MIIITTTIHIPEEDYKKVKALASFKGMNISEFMSKTILEKVEDTLEYEEGINILNECNERVSRENVLKEVFSE